MCVCLCMCMSVQVDTSLTNTGGNPQYKYYYSNPPQIVQEMKAAKVHFHTSLFLYPGSHLQW